MKDQEVDDLVMDDKVFKESLNSKPSSISIKKGAENLKQILKGKVTHNLREFPTVRNEGIKGNDAKLQKVLEGIENLNTKLLNKDITKNFRETEKEIFSKNINNKDDENN